MCVSFTRGIGTKLRRTYRCYDGGSGSIFRKEIEDEDLLCGLLRLAQRVAIEGADHKLANPVLYVRFGSRTEKEFLDRDAEHEFVPVPKRSVSRIRSRAWMQRGSRLRALLESTFALG